MPVTNTRSQWLTPTAWFKVCASIAPQPTLFVGKQFDETTIKRKRIAFEVCIQLDWYRNSRRHRDTTDEHGEVQPASICSDGRKLWSRNGYLHRDNDKPAVVYPSGVREWYHEGLRHREHGLPAMTTPEWDNFIKTGYYQCYYYYMQIASWYRHGNKLPEPDVVLTTERSGSLKWRRFVGGELHQNDIGLLTPPAVIHKSGCKMWYRDGKLHRSCGLPAIVHPNGDSWWYVDGQLHRENDLPAIIRVDANGGKRKRWFIKGKCHRRRGDLPAVTWPDGRQQWWRFGKRIESSELGQAM